MEPISLEQITEQDLNWLARALVSDPYKTTAEEILRGVDKGIFTLWRLSRGVAVTRVLRDGDSQNLFLYCVAGKGVLKELKEELVKVARLLGCKRVGGMAAGSRVKLFSQMGCKELAREMYLEVN